MNHPEETISGTEHQLPRVDLTSLAIVGTNLD
jgi:hypothetical protein